MYRGIDASKRGFIRIGLGIAIMGMTTTDAFSWRWDGVGERLGTRSPLRIIKPRRTPGMACRTEGAEVIISDDRSGKDLIRINETAAYILSMCDGHRSIADIAGQFSVRYDRPASNGIEDVVLEVQVLGRYNAVSF
jgi:hypothetical protein